MGTLIEGSAVDEQEELVDINNPHETITSITNADSLVNARQSTKSTDISLKDNSMTADLKVAASKTLMGTANPMTSDNSPILSVAIVGFGLLLVSANIAFISW